ncbi:MAG: hypothetical protein ABI665_24745 [Vicinamibacterales bacterium]
MFRGLQIWVSGVTLAGFMLAGATVASAQEAVKPTLTFEGDRALMIVLIKPDKTADFELVVAKYLEALGKSDKAARKEQLAGMKVFKSPTQMGGNAAYIFSIDPIVKGEEYDITKVIAEVFPVEVQQIYVQYKDSFAGRQIIPLIRLQ